MALRLPIDNSCPDRRPRDDEADIPRAMRDPVTINCRRGCNLDAIATQALNYPTTDIMAAVGSGKSTLLPRALAKESGTTVFAIVPHPLLAIQLHDYVKSQPAIMADGIETCLLERGDGYIPEQGVVYLSASTMTSVILQTSDASLIRDKIVFLDEAHESNAYSFVLRNLAVQLGARNLVRASATFTGKTFPVRETLSQVQEGEYSVEDTPDTWDVTDSTKPWYFRRGDNTLVFIDSDSMSATLQQKYESVGCAVHRLTVKTDPAIFREICSSLTNSRVISVLLLDYTFRSGFTFDATNVIDVGQVYFMSGKPKTKQKLSRDMYKFEYEQAKGRVARIPGRNATYFRPKRPLEDIRVELEGVEAEAAVYLYRLLGFKPTSDLIDRVLCKMHLPGDITLVEALNGEEPLTCLPLTEEETRKSSPEPPAIPPDIRIEDVVNNVELLEEPDDPKLLPVRLDSNVCDDWNSMIDRFKSYVEPELVCGQSYMPLHVVTKEKILECELFPDGVQSVMQFAARHAAEENYWFRLNDTERKYAISTVAESYNVTIIDIIAMRKALMDLLAKYDADPAVLYVREAVKKVAAESEAVKNQQRTLFQVMCKLAINNKELIPFDGLTSLMKSRIMYYTSTYERILAPVFLMDVKKFESSITEVFNTLQISPDEGSTTRATLQSLPYSVGDSTSVSDSGSSTGSSSNRSSFSAITSYSVDSNKVLIPAKLPSVSYSSRDLRNVKFAPGTSIEAKVDYIDRRVRAGTADQPYPDWYTTYKDTMYTRKYKPR